MKFYKKYMEETLHAIMCITRYNYNALISVKRIRDIYKLDSTNHSKIQLYWRNLQLLEQHGILKLLDEKSPKTYIVLNYFKFFELIHESYCSHQNITEALQD